MHTTKISISTNGRGTYDITREIQQFVDRTTIDTGMCNIFVHHTSASVILCENADPTVREDLERFMANVAPDGDPMFRHRDEGPDDMPAHIRTILTQNSLNLPIDNCRCDLGIWQGVYLWEHRTMAHRRQITLTAWGNEIS
jgi:secondary thiamine-phosphate synthase enzyme